MTTPTFTPPPTAPARTQGPDAYVTNFNAWIAWHTNHFVAEIAAAVTWIADQVVAVAASAAAALASQITATASAAAAVGATGYMGTSTANLTLATGAKAVTGVVGKAFANGDTVTLIYRGDFSQRMRGVVSAANMGAGTMTVTVAAGNFSGAGAQADWIVISTQFETLPAGAVADLLAGVSNTVTFTPAQLYAALTEVALTDASTIAVDMATFDNAGVTLGGSRTLGNPSNTKPGQTGRIRIGQPGVGGPYTLAMASHWVRDGGAPIFSTSANANDFLYYDVISSTQVNYTFVKNPTN